MPAITIKISEAKSANSALVLLDSVEVPLVVASISGCHNVSSVVTVSSDEQMGGVMFAVVDLRVERIHEAR